MFIVLVFVAENLRPEDTATLNLRDFDVDAGDDELGRGGVIFRFSPRYATNLSAL